MSFFIYKLKTMLIFKQIGNHRQGHLKPKANITMIFSGILISAKAIIFSNFYFCGNVLLASLQTFQKLFQYLQPCKFPKIGSYYCPEYFLTTTTMSSSRQKTATVTNKIQHILHKSFLFQQNMSNKSRKVL